MTQQLEYTSLVHQVETNLSPNPEMYVHIILGYFMAVRLYIKMDDITLNLSIAQKQAQII